MKRFFLACIFGLLISSLVVPWSVHGEYFDLNAHNIVGDGGTITGFSSIGSPAFTDNLTLYGNDLITKGPWVMVALALTGRVAWEAGKGYSSAKET